MLIKSLEQKTKVAFFSVVVVVAGAALVCCSTILFCLNMVKTEREQIYILDGNIPFLAERASNEINYDIEAYAHVNLFHQYFFNLAPDDKYIEYSLGKAIYMADESALKQKNILAEAGFFNDLVASSASTFLNCDSIIVDNNTKKFIYYGKQYIKRKTRTQTRSLITSGFLRNVQRSQNNPHGILITDWRTIENKDIN